MYMHNNINTTHIMDKTEPYTPLIIWPYLSKEKQNLAIFLWCSFDLLSI